MWYFLAYFYIDKNIKRNFLPAAPSSSRVFFTHSLAFVANLALSSRHMILESKLAGEKMFGSLNKVKKQL